MTAPVLSDGAAAYTPGVGERRSGVSKFYHSDRIGTNSSITNSSQTVTDTKQYDAFGMLVSSTGAATTPFGFAGQSGYQDDADSGLKLLGHRYFDASTGRFLSRDPAKSGRNFFTYCSNNPTRFLDPTGYGLWTVISVTARIVMEVIGGIFAGDPDPIDREYQPNQRQIEIERDLNGGDDPPTGEGGGGHTPVVPPTFSPGGGNPSLGLGPKPRPVKASNPDGGDLEPPEPGEPTGPGNWPQDHFWAKLALEVAIVTIIVVTAPETGGGSVAVLGPLVAAV